MRNITVVDGERQARVQHERAAIRRRWNLPDLLPIKERAMSLQRHGQYAQMQELLGTLTRKVRTTRERTELMALFAQHGFVVQSTTVARDAVQVIGPDRNFRVR